MRKYCLLSFVLLAACAVGTLPSEEVNQNPVDSSVDPVMDVYTTDNTDSFHLNYVLYDSMPDTFKASDARGTSVTNADTSDSGLILDDAGNLLKDSSNNNVVDSSVDNNYDSHDDDKSNCHSKNPSRDHFKN